MKESTNIENVPPVFSNDDFDNFNLDVGFIEQFLMFYYLSMGKKS